MCAFSEGMISFLELHNLLKQVHIIRCLGLLKQDYHQSLSGLIGKKKIPSSGQVTDTNT